MKKQVKQIGEAALYVGAALATRLLGEGTEHWTDTAKLPGIAPAVAGGILTLSSQVFTSRIYDSFKKTKESFSVDVNADLEKAILNAYKNSLSQIKDDIINDYKLGETGREKIFRYIFNIVDSKYDDTIDLDHTFLTPILNALKSEKIIGEMLKENEQLNPDDFLKKVIKIATPDYDKKDVKYLNDFVNVVCEKFKNYFRHYFRQELKREEKAKTVYFTHLLEGIILNTKDIKKDFSVIRDFAVQGDLKLSELLSSIKKGDDNVKKLEKILNNHQHQVDKRLDSIDKNIKELIAPYLDKQIRKKSFSTSNIYHYKYQYLNFVGRHEEMSSLWNFLADKDENKKFMWWMITAPGGMGKSRIAQRLCIMAKNYNAGFFEFKEDISFNPKWEIWKPEMPTLIVIDYALSKIDKVVNLITTLEQRSEKYSFPVRILLLDREETQQWKKTLTEYPSIDDCLFREKENEGITRLELQPLEKDYRWKIVEEVIKKENKTKWNEIEEAKDEIIEKLNKLDNKHRPLFTFLSAMALAKEDNIRNWNTYKLLEYTLASFEKLWWRNVTDINLREQIKYVLVVNTFCGYLNSKEIDHLLQELKINIKYKSFQNIYSIITEHKIENGKEIWEGLQPDILGEFFILKTIDSILSDEPNNGEELVLKLINASWRLDFSSTGKIAFMAWKDFQLDDAINIFKFKLIESIHKQINLSVNENFDIEFYLTIGYHLSEQGDKLARNKQFGLALKSSELYLKLYPKDSGAWHNKGYVLRSLKRYKEALKAYEKAIQLNPENDNSWFSKGLVLSSIKRDEEALNAYEKAIKLNPKKNSAWYNKGKVLSSLRRDEEALKAYEKAIQLNPEKDSAWVSKGLVLSSLRRDEEALTACEKAIELNPKNDTAWHNKGYFLLTLKRYEEALTACEKALELNPKNDSTWFNKGYILSSLKQYKEALKAYEKAIILNPKKDSAWHNKGTVLSSLKRYEEALTACEKAIQLNPKKDSAWHNKGTVLSSLKRYEEALTAFEKAIQLKPNYDYALYGKGWVLSVLERKEEALKAYEKAIELNPKNESAWVGKGWVLSSLKQNTEALKAYEQAIELNPKNESAWNNKGNLLVSLKRYVEAQEAYDRSLEAHFNSLEMNDKALKEYKNFIKFYPENDIAWYNIAIIYSLKKDKLSVLKNLKQAIRLDIENKEHAKTDVDFKNLWDDEDFIKMTS